MILTACRRATVSLLVLGLSVSLAEAQNVPGVSTGCPGPIIIRPIPPPTPLCSRQVTVSLSLQSDTVTIDMMPGVDDYTRDPGTLSALFALVNRSPGPIPFQIITPDWNTRSAVFILYDSTNTEIWRSIDINPMIKAPFRIRTRLLRSGYAWRIPCQVPLAIDGVPLAAGSYTLEARINGTPCYGAYAPFEVVYAY